MLYSRDGSEDEAQHCQGHRLPEPVQDSAWGTVRETESMMPLELRCIALLPVASEVALVRVWCHLNARRLMSMLKIWLQILSLRAYTGTFTRNPASIVESENYSRVAVWDINELPLLDTRQQVPGPYCREVGVLTT